MVQTWMNADGLYKKFGTLKTVPNTGGEYKTVGELRSIELRIDLTTLTPFGTSIIQNDEIFYPTGMRLQEVEIEVETGAVGATATLSVGLIQTDRVTTTGGGAGYFINGEAVTNLTPAGKKTIYTVGVSGVGTGVGTTGTIVGYITAASGVAVFSAGVIKLRIRYYRPNTN